MLTTLTPVFENGNIVSIIGNTNDISELYKANQEIEYLAYHDTLTGLPNRRKFKEHITRYFNNGTPFALFILDLDECKRINDYLGHNLGDQLLRMESIGKTCQTGT